MNRTAAEEGGSTECLYRTEQHRRELSSTECVTVQNNSRGRGDLRVQGKEDRAASGKALQGDRSAAKGGKLPHGQNSSQGGALWLTDQQRREGNFCMDRTAAKGEGSSTADSAAAKRGNFRHGQNSSRGLGGGGL